MADPKKEAPKPAAKPAPEQHWVITYFPIVLIGILLIIGSRLSGVTIFGEQNQVPTDSISGKKDPFDVYEWVGKGELTLGSTIINTEKTIVRTAPAGSVLGTQKKLEKGRLLEGPVEQFETIWWRVDYPNAPDGWIQYDSVSAKIKHVQILNIVPILYSLYKPVGYVLFFILLLILIYFRVLLSRENKIYDKKQELKLEQYKDHPRPLSKIIEDKPDVQELPGFQTEEIVPIAVAEKNQRWIHIQELIKSYHANDWRQAIIEADIMLEEMLDQMGYNGVTIGDKLKTVEKSDFITLDKAWSAHRVRNQIAHDGSAFKLHRDVAERTIKDFEEVFREFYYI
jgi:hypothetical protein